MIRKILYILPAFLFTAYAALAQADTVQTQTVTVTRSYQPTVRDADKININPPGTVAEDFRKIPVDFHLLDIRAVSTFMAEKGRMVRPQIPNRSRLDEIPGYAALEVGYPGQIQAGGGYVYHTDNDWKLGGELLFGYFNHTDLPGPDGVSRTSVALLPFAEKSADWGRMTYRLDYRLTGSEYQSFTDNWTGFAYHRIRPQAAWHFNRSFFRDASLDYGFLTGGLLGEHDLQARWTTLWEPGSLKIHTDWDVRYTGGTADTASYQNFQAGILPSLRLEKERLLFKLGFKLYYQNRTDVNDNILFYPDVSVDFRMVDEFLTLYIAYDGGLQTLGYDHLLQRTPYVYTRTALRPTSTAYRIRGGFKGAISSRMSYNLELGVRRRNDYPFLVADTTAGQRFDVIYDNLDDYYFKVWLSYVHPGAFETKIRFIYGQYTPETLPKAFNIPDYGVDWMMRFRIGKFGWENHLAYIGPRYDRLGSQIVKLNEYINLRLKLSYRIQKHLQIYLAGYNLLNRNYTPYLNYPDRGLNISAGAFYSF